MNPIGRAFARLRREETGFAMVEFAFVAPIFLTLVLTGLELSNLALAHLRVSQMAMTVADNAGRVTSGIDEANIHETFAGAQTIADGLDFAANGRIVLSSLENNGETDSKKGQVISWQRCWGDADVDPAYGTEGKGKDDATLKDGMGTGANKITAAADTAVMFVEVTYAYQPLVSTAFFTPPTIRYESAFNVRGRQNNAISNTQKLDKMTC